MVVEHRRSAVILVTLTFLVGACLFLLSSPGSEQVKQIGVATHMQARNLQSVQVKNMFSSGAPARERGLTRSSSWHPIQARHPVIAKLQSSMEQHVLNMGHARDDVPMHFHHACLAMSNWLLNGVESGGNGGRLHLAESLHLEVAGYPLSVIEAFALKFGILEKLGFSANRSSISYEVFSAFVDVILKFGYNSQEAKSFYNNTIYDYTGDIWGDKIPLNDLGWLNQWLGTVNEYLGSSRGTHAYRKVPWHPLTGYDYAYSVSELPGPQGKPLVIGVVGDWANGAAGSLFVMEELKKQNPDILIHLGDTYYSGTIREATDFFLNPIRNILGSSVSVFQVPGNHDYYSGGDGFFKVIDELGHQQASFFALRGEHWQIIGMDTGLLDSFNLEFAIGPDAWKQANRETMPFLPSDQEKWVLHQIETGRKLGLKTIMMSHHQFFSRAESLGYANGAISELSTLPDKLRGVYETNAFHTKSSELPGKLPPDVLPSANTRLLSQFKPDVLAEVTAFYWGHEHSSTIFEPYAGIERGRLIGHGCIPSPIDHDIYSVNPATNSSPWGGPPGVLPGSRIGKGKYLWNLGFATITLDGSTAHAKYFQIKQTGDEAAPFEGAKMYFEEKY